MTHRTPATRSDDSLPGTIVVLVAWGATIALAGCGVALYVSEAVKFLSYVGIL